MRTLPLTYKIKRATKGLHGNVYKFPKKDAVLNQFGFNGQLKDNEIYGEGNAYTAEFWEYDPRSIRRWNVDPVDKPWISPYHAFSNKLLTNIDPNGDVDDDYKVDKKGNISLVKKTSDDYDRVIGKNKQGKKESLKIEKGIMSSRSQHSIDIQRSYLNEEGNKEKELVNYSIDLYTGPSEDTQKMFEFLAKTTEVEWSLFKFNQDGIYPHSILSTSHDRSSDVSYQVLRKREFFHKSDLNGHDHNHPSGGTTPSGYFMSEEEIHGDVSLARTLIKVFNNNKIIFRIYTIDNGYTEYDDKTFDQKGGYIFTAPKD